MTTNVDDHDDDTSGGEEEMNNNSEERDNFIKVLYQFMDNRGTPIPDKLPQLGKRRLDLHRLYKEVIRRGGFQACTENKLWRDITASYKVPKTCTSASYSLKNHYKKWIFPYEQVVVFAKGDPLSEEELAKEKMQCLKQSQQQQQQQSHQHQPQHHQYVRSNNQPLNRRAHTQQQSQSQQQQQQQQQVILTTSANRNLGHPTLLEKRTWSHMMNVPTSKNLISYVSKRAKTASEMKDVELLKRIQCSLECGIERHIEWALTKISQITNTIPTHSSNNENYNGKSIEVRVGFKLDSIPSLITTLIEILTKYTTTTLSTTSTTYSSIFNNDFDEMQTEEQALIALIILRNSSFITYNQRLIANNEILMQLLLKMLDNNTSDRIHIEFRIKVLDILNNCSKFIQLSSSIVDVIFDRLNTCICGVDCIGDQYLQVKAKCLEIIDILLAFNITNESNKVISSNTRNSSSNCSSGIQLFESQFSDEKRREMLWRIIDCLKTPTPVHHINEVQLDESDDENDNVNMSDNEEEDESDDRDDGMNDESEEELEKTTPTKTTTISTTTTTTIESGTVVDTMNIANTSSNESSNNTATTTSPTRTNNNNNNNTSGNKKRKNSNNNRSGTNDENSEINNIIVMNENLSEMELLCRTIALNIILKLVKYSSIEFQHLLVSTNRLISRLIQLLIWKSGLQSRMLTFNSNIYNLLSHPHRHRLIELTSSTSTTTTTSSTTPTTTNNNSTTTDINEDSDLMIITDEENEEDFDQDELFDDYGFEDVFEGEKLPSAQMFQKRCAMVLSEFANHCEGYPIHHSTSQSIKRTLQLHEHEFACLILYSTSSQISKHLVDCVSSSVN